MPRTPLLVLFGQALALVYKRWALYLGLVVLAIALQGAIVAFWRAPQALFFANLIVAPILQTVVYAFTAADLSEERDHAWAWGRVLERAWAVIVIDFLLWFVNVSALQTGDGILSFLVASFYMLVGATLLFSDVSATIDDEESLLLLIPRSFVRSIAATWQSGIIWQALALYFLGVLLSLGSLGLQVQFDSLHIPQAAFWANIPLGTLLTPPLSALTALVYLNAKRL